MRKLGEIGIDGVIIERVLHHVPERFTSRQLSSVVEQVRPETAGIGNAAEILRTILFLAQSNYHIDMEPGTPMSELVIFPMSADESRKIKNLQMMRFVKKDGSVLY